MHENNYKQKEPSPGDSATVFKPQILLPFSATHRANNRNYIFYKKNTTKQKTHYMLPIVNKSMCGNVLKQKKQIRYSSSKTIIKLYLLTYCDMIIFTTRFDLHLTTEMSGQRGRRCCHGTNDVAAVNQ